LLLLSYLHEDRVAKSLSAPGSPGSANTLPLLT
jgi:hypothetical protein